MCCTAGLLRSSKLQQTCEGASVKSCLMCRFSPYFDRGNGASVLRIIPYAALHFGAYEYYRELLVEAACTSVGKRVEEFSVPPALDLVAGSAAGATAVLVRSTLVMSLFIQLAFVGICNLS